MLGRLQFRAVPGTFAVRRSLPYTAYTVGWICALRVEYVVACELLDEEYTGDGANTIDVNDNNPSMYTYGRIHEHYVVIACLPQGRYGLSSAAVVAERMRRSFPTIHVCLMVGIAGGAPNKKHDIRLGDVVVSSPTPQRGGVIQYDFGKTVQSRNFEDTNHLSPPPEILLNALTYISMHHARKGHKILETVSAMVEKNSLLKDYAYSKKRMDRLCHASYLHHDSDCACQGAPAGSALKLNIHSTLIYRERRKTKAGVPAVHYGLIASGNQLMKDATVRDALVEKHDVLCFEMEAAGMMNNFPCLVIRGICDYSDTHKNDEWQPFAAATAAAYAKELLGAIPAIKSPHAIRPEPLLRLQTEQLHEEDPDEAPSDYHNGNTSPTTFTKNSTEVVEYNESGQVVKRTLSRTSSHSSVTSRRKILRDSRGEIEQAINASSILTLPSRPRSFTSQDSYNTSVPERRSLHRYAYDNASTISEHVEVDDTEPLWLEQVAQLDSFDHFDCSAEMDSLEQLTNGSRREISEWQASSVRKLFKTLRIKSEALLRITQRQQKMIESMAQENQQLRQALQTLQASQTQATNHQTEHKWTFRGCLCW